MKSWMKRKEVNSIILKSMILFTILVLSGGCNKDDETPAGDSHVETSDLCQALINGVFENVELDTPPVFLDGGEDGFIMALFEVIHYPAEARETGVEGICRLQYEITEEGMVENIEVIEEPGAGIGESAMSALDSVTAGITYSPGVFNGMIVRVKKELLIRYRLE